MQQEILSKKYGRLFTFIAVLFGLSGLLALVWNPFVSGLLLMIALLSAISYEGIEIHYVRMQIRDFIVIGFIKTGTWKDIRQPVQVGVARTMLAKNKGMFDQPSYSLSEFTSFHKLIIRIKPNKNFLIKYAYDIKELEAMKEKLLRNLEEIWKK